MTYQTTDAQHEFDRWSGRYDRDLLQLCFFRPAHHMLLANLTTRHGRVLDIGCGTGKFAERVLHRFPGTQVWGLDLSAGMLRQCQLRQRSARGRMHLVRGDSERLPFEDNAFDAITCTHSFHHYPHQQKVLGEMHRVLRPGGKLLIIDGDRDGLWGQLLFDVFVVMVEGAVTHLTGRAFRRLYTAAGFENVRQLRRGGPLPFLLTVGEAAKPAQVRRRRQAA